MKTFKKIMIEMVLPFITAWFLMTVLVDIITIPTVFRNSSNITDAGKIGMTVFSRFNSIEVFFGAAVLIGSFANLKVHDNKKWLFIAIPMFVLPFIYKFHMTPMITSLTYQIHATDVADPAYAVLQSEHASYHTMYRYFDSAKLFVLLGFFIMVLMDKIKMTKEKV